MQTNSRFTFNNPDQPCPDCQGTEYYSKSGRCRYCIIMQAKIARAQQPVVEPAMPLVLRHANGEKVEYED